jgi:20S proteasome alpha/beta subunit
VTLIVGILCSDGVVMASDSAATLSTGMAPTIGQQAVKKIINLSNAILYASTGSGTRTKAHLRPPRMTAR